jgi:Family of unknown function (DUF6082)
MTTTLSIIATITSSIALIGVAVGLILQARQLRTTQVQASRQFHLDIMKMRIENPVLSFSNDADTPDKIRGWYLNLYVKYLETGHVLGTFSEASVSLQTKDVFESQFSRQWWEAVRNVYQVEADSATRAHKRFFSIVDSEYQAALRAVASSNTPH